MPPPAANAAADKGKSKNFGSRFLGALRGEKNPKSAALPTSGSGDVLPKPPIGSPGFSQTPTKLLAAKKKQQPDDDDVDEAGTETVAPGHAPAGDKKFAVQPTQNGATHSQGRGQTIPESEAPRLVYLTSYGSKVTYPLVWEETTIGRKDDNQIVLTDATISKCHCSVFRKADGCA